MLSLLDFSMLPATLKLASRFQPKMTQAVRNMVVVSGPPQERISFAEKVAHGVAIVVGINIIPVYVLVNLKNYRGEPEQ